MLPSDTVLFSTKICQNHSKRTHVMLVKGRAGGSSGPQDSSNFLRSSLFFISSLQDSAHASSWLEKRFFIHLKEKKKDNKNLLQTLFPLRFVCEKGAACINLRLPPLRRVLINVRLKASIPVLERNLTQPQFTHYSSGPHFHQTGRKALNGLTQSAWILGYVFAQECLLPDDFKGEVKFPW